MRKQVISRIERYISPGEFVDLLAANGVSAQVNPDLSITVYAAPATIRAIARAAKWVAPNVSAEQGAGR